MDYPGNDDYALKDGVFNDDFLDPNLPPSVIPAEWANALMSEILGLIRAADLEPDEANLAQVAQAVAALIAAGDVDKVDGLDAAQLLSRANHTGINNADLFAGQNLAWVRDLANALGTLPANRVQQGPNSGLNADMVDGFHAVDLFRPVLFGRPYGNTWYDTGNGQNGPENYVNAVLSPAERQHTDMNLTGNITMTGRGSLVFRATGTCTINGTIDVDGRGGDGGVDDNDTNEGVTDTHAGQQGHLGGGGGGAEQRFDPELPRGGNTILQIYPDYNILMATGGAQSGGDNLPGSNGSATFSASIDEFVRRAWYLSPTWLGGGGGGSGGTFGGNGGGCVFIVADRIVINNGSQILARGEAGPSGDIDGEQNAGGGGGVVVLAAREFVNFSGLTVDVSGGAGAGLGGDGGTGFFRAITV